MRLVAAQPLTNDHCTSKLSFEHPEGKSAWGRKLYWNGEPLFTLGEACGTCEFFFERTRSSPVNRLDIERLRSALETGLTDIDANALAFREVVPNGPYTVALFTVYPKMAGTDETPDYFAYEQRLAWQGDDADPDEPLIDQDPRDEDDAELPPAWRRERDLYRARILGQYYRGDSTPLGDSTMLFEFLVPLYAPDRLDAARINHYSGLLEAGRRPTAVALAIVDGKVSQRWPDAAEGGSPRPEFQAHVCFANFLLDGHHKVFAAFATGRPITLLSFISMSGSQGAVSGLMRTYAERRGASTAGPYLPEQQGPESGRWPWKGVAQDDRRPARRPAITTADAAHVITDLDMAFVDVAPGTFHMGSDDGDLDETPVREVHLARGFRLSRYVVTNGQYQAFLDASGYDGRPQADHGYLRHRQASGCCASPAARHPVVAVSWHNAVAYCQWLTQRERDAGRLPSGCQYRLPTEAEWEYAARGGPRSQGFVYAGSNNPYEVAWYEANGGNKTRQVGRKSPNELGLFDMSGNVDEWCLDWYQDRYDGLPNTDPEGPGSGDLRVCRGGAWCSRARECRCSSRMTAEKPSSTRGSIGFRVCLARL